MAAIHPDLESVLITEEALQSRISEIGRQITRDYHGESLVLIGVLKGAAMFLSDLARAIDLPVDYDFVKLSSYGKGCEHSGQLRRHYGWSLDIRQRHVLIVEDIVDTGWTLRTSRLTEQIHACGPVSVKVCALLDKPARRRLPVHIDYCGFEIEDRFVVGYGLDWAGLYRNLPYIGVLRSEICAIES